MRKMNLRAWTNQAPVKNGMVYDYLNSPYYNSYGKAYPLNDQTIPVMESVGVRDQKGVTVYEGDILAHSLHSNIIGEVVYSNDRTQYELNTGEGIPLHQMLRHYSLAVVGNCFENPELVELINERQKIRQSLL